MLVSVVATLVVACIFALYACFNWDQVASVLSSQVPLWTIIAVGIITFGAAWLMQARRKRGGVVLALGGGRSRPDIVAAEGMIDMFGVKWKVLFGYQFGELKEPHAVAKGPYCPECMSEMADEKRGLLIKKSYWRCISCGKLYDCGAKSSEDAREIVQKSLEALDRKEQASLRSNPP